MNRIYRTVFNRSLGQLQVAAETTRTPRGGASTSARCLLCGTLLVLCMIGTPAVAAIIHTNNGTIAGNAGADGNNGIGGTGGSAGMGIGTGGTGGNGGSGSAFANGTSGSAGTGGGVGGDLAGISGGANGGGGAGGFAESFGLLGGGGGGGGGNGILDSGTSTIVNNGSISGGNGGNGAVPNTVYGSGGGGGNGISLTASNGSQITNNTGASISGGNGGGGSALFNAGGSGGDGIFLQGDGNTITNAGTITRGGAAFRGLSNGNAIQMVGDNNRVELLAGSNISGNVIASGADNVLVLGGSANAGFDASTLGSQYQGFSVLEKSGTSTWGLIAGASNFSGTTLVSAGTLQASWPGAFSAASAFTVSSGATLDLNYSNQTIGSLAGAGTVNLGSGTLSAGDNNTSTTFSGAINGTGGLTKNGSGALTLTGLNGYTGLTTIHAGTLQIGNGGASGSVSGDILNNGALSFNHDSSTDYTYAYDISGNGALIKADNNILTLTGSNTYTGLTTLSAGTLQIGNGGTDGSLTGDVLNNAELVFNRSDDSVYGGDISGSGTLYKLGTGKLVLDGISSIGGGSRVDAGSLIVGGNAGSSASLTGDVDVASGSLLGGHGSITGNVDLASGATLAPGNSIGTLTINGNATFDAASTLEIEANPDGTSDRLIVNGTLDLGGATLSILAGAGTWSPTTSYTIVTSSNPINGTFGTLTSDLAFLTPTLDYSLANQVHLLLARNDISYASVARTFNQRAVATALGSAPLATLAASVTGMSAAQAQATFDSLSGELHASTRGALFDDSRYVREAITDRLRAAQSGAAMGNLLHHDARSGLTLWLKGYGSWSDKDGNNNVADLERDNRGTLLGADLPLNETWRLGAAIGYGNSDLNISQRDSSVDIDSTSLAAYLGGRWNALSLRLGVAHSWNQLDSRREVQVATLRNTLKADCDATTTQVFGELGYALQLGGLNLEPFAGLAHVEVDSESFREHGGTAALSGESENDSIDYASLGLRAATPLGEIAGLPLGLQASLAWQHAFDGPSDESALSLAGYNSFTVQGVPLAEDSALAQLGVGLQLAPQASLELSYSGQFGDGNSDHGVHLGLHVAF